MWEESIAKGEGEEWGTPRGAVQPLEKQSIHKQVQFHRFIFGRKEKIITNIWTRRTPGNAHESTRSISQVMMGCSSHSIVQQVSRATRGTSSISWGRMFLRREAPLENGTGPDTWDLQYKRNRGSQSVCTGNRKHIKPTTLSERWHANCPAQHL